MDGYIEADEYGNSKIRSQMISCQKELGVHFIEYEADVSNRLIGVQRGVVGYGKLFTETSEQKFNLGRVQC